MLIEPSFDLYEVELDGSADAVVWDLATFRQIVDMLLCTADQLRDHRGANKLWEAKDLRVDFQRAIPLVRIAGGLLLTRSMAYGYCHLSAVWDCIEARASIAYRTG